MCECTPKVQARYCGRPGCRDPLAIEVEQLRATLALQQASYDREREIDKAEIERLRDAMAHAAKELEDLDDETAQAQTKTLREMLGHS